MRRALFWMAIVGLSMTGAWAQQSAPIPTSAKPAEKTSKDKTKDKQRHEQMENQAAVLDFEGELIEGERKRPDLFLQIGTQKQSMEAIVYGRKNFNDFHKNDKRQRPSYFEAKEISR